MSFARKYQKQLLDTGLDAVKTVSKKVLHKGGKFLGNTFPDTVTESNNDKIVKPDENSRNVTKNLRFKTSMLRSNLCNYSDAYIVTKGTIDLLAAAANENDKAQKNVAYKTNSPFRLCISKTNSTLTDNGKDFDIVNPMYDLLEYSQNYSMTSGS